MQVTLENFIRAETDVYLKRLLGRRGQLNVPHHARTLVPTNKQVVVRTNRDTLFSHAVLDLQKPVVVHMPEHPDRYVNLHVINQDHYTKLVTTDPGDFEITQNLVGTRYACVLIRTLIDEYDEQNVREAHALQDAIEFRGEAGGELDIPEWDRESLSAVRRQVVDMGKESGWPPTGESFGDRDEVDPRAHLVCTASGWGGLPRRVAVYLGGTVELNDGETPHEVTVKDVPADGFWSVTVYNKHGFWEEHPSGRYTVNNLNATPNEDGSVTIRFGGSPDRPNFLPIMKDWNYTARLYTPHDEVLEGRWKFPEVKATG